MNKFIAGAGGMVLIIILGTTLGVSGIIFVVEKIDYCGETEEGFLAVVGCVLNLN